MSNVLILDCGCKNYGVGGTLNHYFADVAAQTLQELGHTVKITRVEDDYNMTDEGNKIKWADVVIVQTPAWWMAPPWQFKRYQDLVFRQVAGSDGRHHDAPTKNYGRGGLLTDKKYMICTTWNAPKEAFTDKNEFYEGAGIDAAFIAVHKAFQFIGMKPLPTFMSNDVLKNPQIERDIGLWKEHLKNNIP